MKLCPICATSYPEGHRTCPTHGTVLVETAELLPGTVIRDCYRILRTLGKGGMGTVYLAEHTLMGEPRALKFLSSALASNPTFVQRFLQEARAASKLRHPNIATTYELGQSEDGSFYISMEYVDGPSLRAAITQSPQGIPPERAFRIIHGVAEALAAAHAKQMVHRDIKPENILLSASETPHGPTEIPKVVDFGIVAMNDGASHLTQTGRPLLTAEYAAPEQWRGAVPSAELDGRTDLYSMGCMFFEMLTGQQPFHAESYEGWFEQHVYSAPPAVSFIRPELARYPGLDEMVLTLLAKDRERRTANVERFLNELDLVIAHGSGTRSISREPTRNDLYVGQGTVPPPERKTAIDVRTASKPEYPANPPWQQVSPQSMNPGMNPGWQQSPSPPISPPIAPGYGAYPPQPTPPVYPQQYATPPPSRRQTSSVNKGVLFTVLGTFLLLTIGVVGTFVYLRHNQDQNQTQSGQSTDSTQIDQPAPQPQPEPPSLPSPSVTNAPTAPTQPAIAANQSTRPRPAAAAKGPAALTDPVSIAARAIALYNEKQYTQAASLLAQACASGQADSCDYLGYAYQHKLGVDEDFSRAVASYEKGCQANSLAACSHLASMFLSHTGVAEDDQRALGLFTRACNGDYAEACMNLGNMYQYKKGVAQDFPRAVTLYGKACNAGSMAACNSLGMLYQRAQGVEQDYAKALSLYGKACDANIADGCNNLGFMYQKKLGVEQDYVRAASFFTKACDGGNAFACNNIGIMYQDSEGVELDYAKAATYYAKACNGGSSNGCSDLGELYRKGSGVPKDSEKARTYLSKGCSMGNQWGCDHLKLVQ